MNAAHIILIILAIAQIICTCLFFHNFSELKKLNERWRNVLQDMNSKIK